MARKLHWLIEGLSVVGIIYAWPYITHLAVVKSCYYSFFTAFTTFVFLGSDDM